MARLKQTFSRVRSSWRPASQEESYEIVRRRLFKEIPGDRFHHRDNTLKQFVKLYRENSNDFPQGCSDEDYRRKLEKAYPIHPELFDQLYVSWGSGRANLQRTRGVLRLMAQVIHELWMSNGPSVMIMPGSVAISSSRVEPELLHYLPTNWQSIIAGMLMALRRFPIELINRSNLNRYSATRRIARAIFMGSAPTSMDQNRGLDDKQINLGVVQPGQSQAISGDALRRLANQAKFMTATSGGTGIPRHLVSIAWLRIVPGRSRRLLFC